MSDKNLRHQGLSVTTQQLTAAWSAITPGDETAKMVLRSTGTFRLASSAAPGGNYMTIPSGTQFEYDGGAVLYASMPAAGVLQVMKFS